MGNKFSNNTVFKLVFVGLLAVGCSGNEKKDQASVNDKSIYTLESQASTDEILFDDDKDDSQQSLSSENKVEEAKNEVVSESEHPTEAVEEVAQNQPIVEKTEEAPVVADVAVSAPVSLEDLSVYRVQADNETLMLISFKIYGDYRRWREIAHYNKEMFDDRYIIKKGMMLKFKMPETEFKWKPKGEPYVIKMGDTLSGISNFVYNSFRRWKEIYNNNKPLIRDPNKIFSGFTIFYVPDANKMELSQTVAPKEEAVQEQLKVEESIETVENTQEAVESVANDSNAMEANMDSLEQAKVEGDNQVADQDENSPLRSKDRNPTSL